jgi:hypothetical protein
MAVDAEAVGIGFHRQDVESVCPVKIVSGGHSGKGRYDAVFANGVSVLKVL